MSDLTNEIKTALLELVQDLVAPKVFVAGTTGFGPIPASNETKVYVQNSDSAGVWFTLNADKKRSYIQELSFTGYIERLDTRDQDSSESPHTSRKIDLTMRKADGSMVTFVFGIMVNISSPEHNAVAKALLAGLSTCTKDDLVTIAPSAGEKKFVVLLQVLRNGALQMNQWGDDDHTSALLVELMERFGGTHSPLKDTEAPQPQQQRSVPAAATAKSAPSAAPKKGKRVSKDTDQQWRDIKTYLGDDPEAIEETRALVMGWCMDQYQIKSPMDIPALDQKMAFSNCKQYLDSLAPVVEVDWTQVEDESFEDVPF